MKEIKADKKLIAYCGLYCGACGAYLKGRCLGCHENVRVGWCKVRSCCQELKYSSCADCKTFPDPKKCKKFHNFISKTIGLFLNSNRAACIGKIRELGSDGYCAFMAESKIHALPRKAKR
jgi:hypothetical protein